MKRTIITLMAVAATFTLHADNVQGVLSMIEQNNTTLKALRTSCEAEKLGNRTELTLSDPEIGFEYMWNNTPGVPNQKNFTVAQNFDYATISGLKSRLAKHQNLLTDWNYQIERMNIMLEAKQFAIDVIYYNAMLNELDKRKRHAAEIVALQKISLEEGNGNQLEYNNARINMLKLDGEIKRNLTERDAAISQLVRLNGGSPIILDDTEFTSIPMPEDFEEWYAEAKKKNPVLAYVRQEIEVNKKQLSLNRSMAVPSFTVGYAGEFVGSERSQGITLGINIPLWSNKNRVRQAKMAVREAGERHADMQLQYYSNLKIMFLRTLGLKESSDTYRMTLKDAGSQELLRKALDEGHMSVFDYFTELSVYYETVNRALEAERDYHRAYAELTAAEL